MSAEGKDANMIFHSLEKENLLDNKTSREKVRGSKRLTTQCKKKVNE